MANSNECKRNFVAVYDGGRWDFMNSFDLIIGHKHVPD